MMMMEMYSVGMKKRRCPGIVLYYTSTVPIHPPPLKLLLWECHEERLRMQHVVMGPGLSCLGHPGCLDDVMGLGTPQKSVMEEAAIKV